MTLVVFAELKTMNSLTKEITASEKYNKILQIDLIVMGIFAIINVVVIVLTGIMIAKNKYQIKGLGLLFSSGIVTLFFL